MRLSLLLIPAVLAFNPSFSRRRKPHIQIIGINDFDMPYDPPHDTTKSDNFELIQGNSITFEDVGGYNSIKEELLQCSSLLLNKDLYNGYNIRIPKGVILEGPPGNGKTLLARGLSGTLNVSFISTSGSVFQEKYVGVGASRVRELFELASKHSPTIIFIDEVDAICRKRGERTSTNSEGDTTLNQLLVQLDGFKPSDNIFLICATNRVELLDPAFLRPGRIDKKIYVGNPDKETRQAILDIHIQGKPYDSTISISELNQIISGLSGAEIENLLNEAMLYALRNKRKEMTMKDIDQCLARIRSGFQDSKLSFSPLTIKRIAAHELGHGISGLLLSEHPPLESIHLNLQSPKSPGYTVFRHEDIDSNIHTKEKLMAQLTVLVSGRVAEEM
jgi:cell division protease FtsH